MCRALVSGDRQFSGEQLRRLIERDALIGMPLDAWMLHPGWTIGHTPPNAVSLRAISRVGATGRDVEFAPEPASVGSIATAGTGAARPTPGALVTLDSRPIAGRRP